MHSSLQQTTNQWIWPSISGDIGDSFCWVANITRFRLTPPVLEHQHDMGLKFLLLAFRAPILSCKYPQIVRWMSHPCGLLLMDRGGLHDCIWLITRSKSIRIDWRGRFDCDGHGKTGPWNDPSPFPSSPRAVACARNPSMTPSTCCRKRPRAVGRLGAPCRWVAYRKQIASQGVSRDVCDMFHNYNTHTQIYICVYIYNIYIYNIYIYMWCMWVLPISTIHIYMYMRMFYTL